MNATAIMHSTAALLALVGILVSQLFVRIGAIVLAIALFVGGIIVARQDDSEGSQAAEA